MVNHICGSTSRMWATSCRSIRALQGGGGEPLTKHPPAPPKRPVFFEVTPPGSDIASLWVRAISGLPPPCIHPAGPFRGKTRADRPLPPVMIFSLSRRPSLWQVRWLTESTPTSQPKQLSKTAQSADTAGTPWGAYLASRLSGRSKTNFIEPI
jgi:hypothetical protein